MKTFLDFITYDFCLLLGITRYRYYIIDDNGDIIRLKIKHIPTTIKYEDKYFMVKGEVTEIINKTLVYVWLKIDKL